MIESSGEYAAPCPHCGAERKHGGPIHRCSNVENVNSTPASRNIAVRLVQIMAAELELAERVIALLCEIQAEGVLAGHPLGAKIDALLDNPPSGNLPSGHV